MRKVTCTLVLALITIVFSATAFAQYSQPVRDVENPSQNPFWAVGSGSNTKGFVNFFVNIDQVTASIPTGKRLTLEFIAVRCTTPADDSISEARITVTKKPGTQMQFPIQIARQGTDVFGQATWVTSQMTRLYLDSVAPFEKIYLNVFHKNYNDDAGTTTCSANISGSLVNAP